MNIPERLPAGARPLLLVVTAYAALAVAWAAPASLSPRDSVPDLGDPLHLAWVMAWDAHQIVRRPWALFEANAFHPYRHSLTFSDHLLPEALMAAPVFWATGNAVLASNLAVLTALVLSATTSCLLVRYACGSWPAGFLAGLIYAFNALTQHEVPRVHVISLEWWPLAWLFLLCLVEEGRPRHARWMVAALALQVLSGTYYLVYTALLAPAWLGGAYWVRGRFPGPAERRALAMATVVATAGGLVLLWPYLVQFRSLAFEKSWAAGADLVTYLSPPRRALLWGMLWPSAVGRGRAELPHFVGLGTAVLVVVGIVRIARGRASPRERRLGMLGLVTAVAGLLLSMGPLLQVGGTVVGPGPYGLLYRFVAAARGMASPERAGVLAVLGAAVLAGIGAAGLLTPLPAAGRALLTALLAVLLPLEHWSPPRPADAVPTGAALPSVYAWLKETSSPPLVELPLFPERNRRAWAAYLYFSTVHWRPLSLGRASFYPPLHDWLAWNLRGFPDATSLAALDRLGIRTVVLHPHVWDAAERAQRLAAVMAEPRLRLRRQFNDVVPARFSSLGLGDERVYEVAPEPPPASPCRPQDELPREGWQLASTGVNKPDRVRDGDAQTAWFTARPQRPGDRLDVELAPPDTVAAVALQIGYPYEEFGRNLVLAVTAADGPWHRVAYADGPAERLATLDDLLQRPREAWMVLRLPPETVGRLRLMVGAREEEPAWPRWAVPELRLYRACR